MRLTTGNMTYSVQKCPKVIKRGTGKTPNIPIITHHIENKAQLVHVQIHLISLVIMVFHVVTKPCLWPNNITPITGICNIR